MSEANSCHTCYYKSAYGEAPRAHAKPVLYKTAIILRFGYFQARVREAFARIQCDLDDCISGFLEILVEH